MAARGRSGAVRHAGAALARPGRTARGACGAVQQRGVLHHWRHDPGLWRGPLGHHGEGNAPHPARRRLQRAPPRQPRLGRGRGHLRLYAKHRRGGTLSPCPAPYCQTHGTARVAPAHAGGIRRHPRRHPDHGGLGPPHHPQRHPAPGGARSLRALRRDAGGAHTAHRRHPLFPHPGPGRAARAQGSRRRNEPAAGASHHK